MRQIIVLNMQIEYEKKRIKNLYIRVLPPDGRVHVSAPLSMPEAEVIKFIISKEDWILKQQQRIKLRNTDRELHYSTGESIQLWGKDYMLVVSEKEGYSRVWTTESSINLAISKNSTLEHRKRSIDIFYRKELEGKLPDLIAKWENRIGVRSRSWSIRNMKTRWGTCNIRTKHICINLQLVKKHPICLEYVVAHELVHLLERSHNSVFKAYMDQFFPGWRNVKRLLNDLPPTPGK